MNTDVATALAQDALIWLSGDPEVLSHFLAATGLSAADLRARHSDPEFLGFLLDFVLMSDENVIALACAASVDPAEIARARAALPGGDLPNWT